MKVVYIHKYNNRKLYKPLHPCYEDMLRMCANDLTVAGFRGTVRVILQTGKSREQSRYCGTCLYSTTSIPTIYVYTYRRRIMTNVDTIAHEFGHISHYVTIPESKHWKYEQKEWYANKYAELMIERFHAQRSTANWAA